MFVSPRTPKELRAIWISLLTLRPLHPVYCVGPPQICTPLHNGALAFIGSRRGEEP